MSRRFEDLDVIVVGGGISGLVCGLTLRRRGANVVVLDAGSDPGGCIRTLRSGGYVADGGPQSFLSSPPFVELVRELGLGTLLRKPAVARVKRYIYNARGLMALPSSPLGAMVWPGLSPKAKLRVFAEPFVPSRKNGEESVASFFTRRAGPEVVDAVVAPILSGICAGDPAQLSLRSVFPALARMEREYGSFIIGALANMRKSGWGRARAVAFGGGNDVLPRALAAGLGPALRKGVRVARVSLKGAGFAVDCKESARFVAPRVVVATPAPVAADLIEYMEPDAAAALREIQYAPVTQIVLAYPAAAVGVALDGFGFLTTKDSGLRILGAVYNSALFPDRSPTDEVLVTAFVGGATDPASARQPDDALAKVAHEDLLRALKLSRLSPKVVAGFRWEEGLPQYTLGHEERVACVEGVLRRLPNLHLCGNYLRGASITDCIRQARAVAGRISVDR